MKTVGTALLLLLVLAADEAVSSRTVTYVSPKDNSILVSLSTNIVVKCDRDVDPSTLSSNGFSAAGSLSGIHHGTVRLSDDKKTIVFLPATPFSPGEDVTARVAQGVKTADGESLPAIEIHFKTTPMLHSIVSSDVSEAEDGSAVTPADAGQAYLSPGVRVSTDSLPSDFPKITLGTSSNPAPGNIFIANKAQNGSASLGYYLIILNNDASVARYLKVAQQPNLFKMESNGNLAYTFSNGGGSVFILDTSFTPIDTLRCGNGYKADAHDFILLPNGHALLFSNDPQPVDMSQVVSGGSSSATVTGTVIQELDASKNVVFQWRSWDCIPMTASYADLTAQNVDLLHTNALALDLDGNILVSMRHLSSIVKIDRQTGDVMWFLGGKQNQFTFINEHASNSPTYFSYQHNVEVLPNGNITLFDNGNQHSPNYSRGVEYALDVQNKTATMVWEYRHTPDIYANSAGSLQRLPNGNTIIGWASGSRGGSSPTFTEVHPDNSTALEFSLPTGQIAYRSYKFEWRTKQPQASVAWEILPTNTYAFDNSTDTTGITVTIRSLASIFYPELRVARNTCAPLKPRFTADAPILASNYFSIEGMGFRSYTGDVHVDLRRYPAVTNPRQTIVYARTGRDSVFVPIPTSYDSTKNQLVFATSTLGDFAFGVPQASTSAYAPVPLSPKDGEIANEDMAVKLVWGTRGIVGTYHLQVSNDAAFSNLAVDLSGLTSTSFTMDSVGKGTTYYWRVNNTNAAGTSDWSIAVSFSTAAPYLRIISPNGGENIYAGSTYVIRWESNTSDTVRIGLMNVNKTVAAIGDSIRTGSKAYQWKVPSNLMPDSNYRMLISSISNPNVSGISSSPFFVLPAVSGVTDNDVTVKTYELSQNYPNPFNPSTTITYELPQASQVRLTMYDMLGREVSVLVDERRNAGVHEVKFDGSRSASGVYFYRLVAGSHVITKTMVLLK